MCVCGGGGGGGGEGGGWGKRHNMRNGQIEQLNLQAVMLMITNVLTDMLTSDGNSTCKIVTY